MTLLQGVTWSERRTRSSVSPPSPQSTLSPPPTAFKAVLGRKEAGQSQEPAMSGPGKGPQWASGQQRPGSNPQPAVGFWRPRSRCRVVWQSHCVGLGPVSLSPCPGFPSAFPRLLVSGVSRPRLGAQGQERRRGVWAPLSLPGVVPAVLVAPASRLCQRTRSPFSRHSSHPSTPQPQS